jgi:hypothetical protein
MKPKVKQYLKIGSVFVGGLILGVVIMGYMSMRASKTFIKVLRSGYHTEQIKMAVKAYDEGNKYAEFIHRSNVVTASPFGKGATFDNMTNTWTFGFPFASPVLDCIADFSCQERGRSRVYGIEIGQLAEATENIGLREEAQKLWEESAKLTEIKDITKLRSFIGNIHKIEAEAKAKQYGK